MLVEIILALGLGPIRCASGVEQARAVLLNYPVDLIISDLHMPGEDGFSLTRWVRDSKSSWIRQIPIIILSGETTIFNYERARCCGSDYFVSKPFTVKSLANAIIHSMRVSVNTPTQIPCEGHGDTRCPLLKPAPSQRQLTAQIQTIIEQA
jgi:DNA-binding response OmpR family regulator